LKKRELSYFMVQEMLYDYATGSLDKDRHSDVKAEIEKSKSLQDELFQIQTGLSYINKINELKISTSLLEDIKSEKNYLHFIKNSLSISQWPPIVKWTIEAFAIIFTVVVLTVVIPWDLAKEFVFRESRTELILAEVSKKSDEKISDVLVVEKSDEKKESDTFEDEEKVPVLASASAIVKNDAKPQAPPSVDPIKTQGFVYRGTASVINAQMGSVKLKEKIVEFGGRKAGEVELGWRRNQGDYYFHFTIPESRYEELQEYIKTLGELKISRDPHPRIMPNGIIRIILTAQESKN